MLGNTSDHEAETALSFTRNLSAALRFNKTHQNPPQMRTFLAKFEIMRLWRNSKWKEKRSVGLLRFWKLDFQKYTRKWRKKWSLTMASICCGIQLFGHVMQPNSSFNNLLPAETHHDRGKARSDLHEWILCWKRFSKKNCTKTLNFKVTNAFAPRSL